MKELLCLLFVSFLVPFISGCGEEDTEPDLRLPEIVSTDPENGSRIFYFSPITFRFNKPMKEVTVTGTDGHFVSTTDISVIISDGIRHSLPKTWSWQVAYLVEDPYNITLTVNGKDFYDQAMKEFIYSCTILPYSFSPPEIVGGECDPKNMESGVDPQQYLDGLTIVFDEDLANVEVVGTDPEFPFTDELNGHRLRIQFIEGYTMPYNTKFAIELRAWDLAYNRGDLVYSFTTISMADQESSKTTSPAQVM